MAAGFCTRCGKPLKPGAQFCEYCGAPVAGVTSGTGPGPASPTRTVPGQYLTEVLGLRGGRSFLVQLEFSLAGRSYRVMTTEKQRLFSVRENVDQEVNATLGGLLGPSGSTPGQGLSALGRPTFLWTISDAAENPQGHIQLHSMGLRSICTLIDPAGNPILSVNVDRELLGGIAATEVSSEGTPLLKTGGNLLRHNFSIADPSGREVAKVHEAWVSLRDTFALDLVTDSDPLGPLVLAIVIDGEKGSR